MVNGQRVEGFNGGHPCARGVSEKHPIFHMAGEYPPGAQHPQKVGRQKIHLLKESLRVLIVPQVVIAGGVLVMVGEGDAGHDQVHAVCLHLRGFLDGIRQHRPEMASPHFHPLHADAPFHFFHNGPVVQPIVPHQAGHFGLHGLVVFPLGLQRPENLHFAFHVDDVNDDRLILQEAVNAVYGLNKVIEFIVDAHKNGPVTMPLEIAPAAADLLFRGQQPRLALGKGDDSLFPLLQVQAAVHLHRLGHLPLDFLALFLQVVPQDEVRLRVAVHDLLGLCYPCPDGFPLFPRRVLEAQGCVPQQLDLPVLVAPRRAVVHGKHMIPYLHGRQRIACVVIAQVGMPLDAQRPGAHP